MGKLVAIFTLSMLLAVIALICLNGLGRADGNNETPLSQADAALYLAKHFSLPYTDDPKTLYGLYPGVFPGGYDGQVDFAYWDKPLTLEVLTVVLVRQMGWDTVYYDQSTAERIRNYVSPQGFPYYAPDPTPRSIPYVVVALEKGLLMENELPNLLKEIGKSEVDLYLERLNKIMAVQSLLAPYYVLNADDISNLTALNQKLGGQYPIVIIPKGAPSGAILTDEPLNVVDLRSSDIRIYSGPSAISNGKQSYFPLGPLQTLVTAGLAIPESSFVHQGEALAGITENQSTTANAIGIWGAGESEAKGARVWGGFLTAESAEGDGNDSQLIGLEVDVTNRTKPGVSPNASKVGEQIVALGTAESTNALEILGTPEGKWQNGINISTNSIASNGTAIGLSQTDPIKYGIDFSQTPFTNAAIAISNNSLLAFKSKTGADAGIYSDDIGNGYLVIRSGPDGLRITNNENSVNLFSIDQNGLIGKDSLFYKNYIADSQSSFRKDHATALIAGLIIVGILVISLIFWNVYLQRQIAKIREGRDTIHS